MTLDEVYLYYGGVWTNITTALGFTSSMQQYWQRRGSIPFKTQLQIEAVTHGDLKADITHDNLRIAKQKAVKVMSERRKQRLITAHLTKAAKVSQKEDLEEAKKY